MARRSSRLRGLPAPQYEDLVDIHSSRGRQAIQDTNPIADTSPISTNTPIGNTSPSTQTWNKQYRPTDDSHRHRLDDEQEKTEEVVAYKRRKA